MMDHILQFDWFTPTTQEPYFVSETELDNCNIQKILSNKFRDPLLTSSEEEEDQPDIDWDKVFQGKNSNRSHRVFVPGLHAVAPYPKVSTMTAIEHFKGIKVLCDLNPNVLEEMKIPSASVFERHNFELMQQRYEDEKKEYIEWAKSLWVSQHCVRALRPKPAVEMIYEAEFKVRAQRLGGYPERFEMAAQIPLECTRVYDYQATLKETLVDVQVSDLPQVQIPKWIKKNNCIIKPCSVPEPCQKHPYQFILPTEKNVSVLPITELHRELAQYAADNGTKFIASENALRCLVEFNRSWTIPVTVCSAYNNEGERCHVVVLDSEFAVSKEPATKRTFRAFRHLLENALIPASEIEARIQKSKVNMKKEPWRASRAPPHESQPELGAAPRPRPTMQPEPYSSSDDEPLGLCIMDELDTGLHTHNTRSQAKKRLEAKRKHEEKPVRPASPPVRQTRAKKSRRQDSHDDLKRARPSHKVESIFDSEISREDIEDIIGVYNCTCSDSPFEIPPPRSFKKWQFTNKNTQESLDVIVHCPHKARLDSTEVILEPLPEYQLELGASEQPPDRIRSTAVSLILRDNASVLNCRVDGGSGALVSLAALASLEWRAERGAPCRQALNVLHTALSELQGLVPGQYVLQHEPHHGSNAFLLVARAGEGAAGGPGALRLHFDAALLADPDEAALARAAPTITSELLPYHKFRRILPCAFTPFPNQVAKDTKKQPPSKQKSPPQAIQWPKKKKSKKNMKKKT